MKGHRCRARTCPHPPTPLLTLIYLVLYWSANTFVPPLCVAGSLLVSVDLCCCAEWVTSASWFNLGYTRLKRDWIKDAEGLDLPVLAVSSCLLLLFCSVFLPLTHLGCAGHWPPRCLCRFSVTHPLTSHSSHSIRMRCFAYLCSFTSLHRVLICWLASSAAITFTAHASCLRSPLTRAKACSAYLLCWIIWFPPFTIVTLPFHVAPV